MNGKRTKKPITVTIINPEDILQASINYTKTIVKMFFRGRIKLANEVFKTDK